MRLKDKVAIITGSGQGIGEAIARRFSAEGAKVVIDDIVQERIDRVTEDLKAEGADVLGVNADVSNYSQVDMLIQKTLKAFGTVDILVNNAGIIRDATIMKMSEEDWDKVIDVNLKGAYNCIHHVGPVMKNNQYGKIISISSAVRFGNIGQANYSASKAGLVGLTRTTALEYGRYGINVNAIAPGYIETKMIANIPPKIREMAISTIPLHRTGQVVDISNLCLFLASDESSYITGQVIQCDGGLKMP